MKPIDKTDPSQAGAIAFELDLPHPPAKVWRALSEPHFLEQWLLPMVGQEFGPGANFQFQAPPQGAWDGTVNCRVLAFEPERRLSWAWVVGELDTVVTFTLTPTQAGTLLSLTQTGFGPEQKPNFAGARYGWNMMAARLVDLLATFP